MPVSASQLSWPGVDHDRTLLALYHLDRSLAALRGLLREPSTRWWRLPVALEHRRLAAGYLGAVGFEKGGAPWP